MKKEKNIIIITMLLNLLVASIKLISGIMFNFSTLIADSLQSLSDFVTDIISVIANKIGKKRANKKYPFGYGMADNIANLLIGIILTLLSVYIFIESFHTTTIKLQPIIFIILILTILLKLLTIYILYCYGKKLSSNSLIVSSKESSTDLIASIIVLIISILLLFKETFPILSYANNTGGIIISIIILITALKIIIENIRYLLGTSEDDEEIIKELIEVVNKNEIIKDNSIKLMKIGSYYNLYLTIELDNNVTLKRLFNLEKNLKKEIRKVNKKIRFIEIEPKEYD